MGATPHYSTTMNRVAISTFAAGILAASLLAGPPAEAVTDCLLSVAPVAANPGFTVTTGIGFEFTEHNCSSGRTGTATYALLDASTLAPLPDTFTFDFSQDQTGSQAWLTAPAGRYYFEPESSTGGFETHGSEDATLVSATPKVPVAGSVRSHTRTVRGTETIYDPTSDANVPVAGAAVRLQKRSGSSWATVKTGKTNAAGKVSLSVSATKRLTYRLVFAAVGGGVVTAATSGSVTE